MAYKSRKPKGLRGDFEWWLEDWWKKPQETTETKSKDRRLQNFYNNSLMSNMINIDRHFTDEMMFRCYREGFNKGYEAYKNGWRKEGDKSDEQL
jgi:hypothetical protein